MILCQDLKAKKANKSKKYPKKAMCIKKKYWTIWVQNCQSYSLPVSWKLNISLTQKDTMDRGAWIKNSERKASRRNHKGQKVQKHKKCKMAWEWGTNEYFCLPYVTILWCPSWKLPEDRGNKWNSSSWPQKNYLDLEILVSILLNWNIIND